MIKRIIRILASADKFAYDDEGINVLIAFTYLMSETRREFTYRVSYLPAELYIVYTYDCCSRIFAIV